jgi:hypothetical protein
MKIVVVFLTLEVEINSNTDRSSEIWYVKSMDKISWTDRVKNEEVLQSVKEESNIQHTIKRRKAD